MQVHISRNKQIIIILEKWGGLGFQLLLTRPQNICVLYLVPAVEFTEQHYINAENDYVAPHSYNSEEWEREERPKS